MDQKQWDEPTLSNPGRRRFTRGGLATPVVLGSLVSQPVLGQVGHQCTLSGQLSGNTSVHGAQTPCNTLGNNTSYWLNSTTWPSPIVRGALSNGGPNVQATSGTAFDGWTVNTSATSSTYSTSGIFASTESMTLSGVAYTLAAAFKVKNGQGSATMLQVLMNVTNTTDSELGLLGVATVTSLLNALFRGSAYPVSVGQIIAMFNATYNGGTYLVGGTTQWARSQVITYMQSLYM